jgi:pullulanase/glycogen debranching enzyme
MIYFGDEVGMWGSNDPNNRKPMVWKDLGVYQDPQQAVDTALLDYYRTVIALRTAHPALRTGTFRTVRTDDAQDVWAFVRAGHGEELLVALNASDRPATVSFADLGDGWQDVYGTAGFADNGLVTAIANDIGFDQIFVSQLRVHWRDGDRLLAISASGNSPNLVAACWGLILILAK